MKYAMLSAATAALFSSASAVSTFAVVNHCTFDIFLWSVEGGKAPSQMFTLPANQPHIGYSETYRYVSPYAGVSIKVAPYYVGNGQIPPPSLNITQLEYTVPAPGSGDPNIWYDLSMVNGNAFMGIPFTYSPSSPAAPNCIPGSCTGSYEECSAGYNYATDDSHTHACAFSNDIIFTFCDGNSQSPLLVPTGQVSTSQFSKLTCINGGACDPSMKKRETEAEPEADPLAVCYSAADANSAAGVPILAALCPDAASTTTQAASSTTTTTSSSTTFSSSTTAAAAPSAVAALQQPAPQASTTSSSSAAAAATQAAAAPASGPPTSPLSQLQLSSLANTGVTCWQSVTTGETCGVAARGLPEKRSIHEHSHRHNHQAFHRRNRIVKSAA